MSRPPWHPPRGLQPNMPMKPDYYLHGTQCILCGDFLYDNKGVWRAPYRALYQAAGSIKLSGIGYRKNSDPLKVPIDPDKRWDTTGSDFCTVSDLPCWPRNIYFFHEICWQRLAQHFAGDNVDYSALYDVLKRLPFPAGYGASSYIRYMDGIEPYQAPLLIHLLQSKREQPECAAEIQNKLKRSCNATDCFRRLPVELIELLGDYLSTRDYLNSRLASRTMGMLFHQQKFWKTRFDINGERGFLSYLVKEHQNRDVDWRLLYHSTCTLRCSRLFDITIRLWETNRWIREAVIHKSRGPFASFMGFGGRALQYYHNTMWPETNYRQTVKIPPDLIKIGVSAFADFGDQVVTIRGLELIRASGPSILLGAKIPGSLVIVEEVDDHGGGRPDWADDHDTNYRFPGAEVILDAQELRGFMITNTVNGQLTHFQLIRKNGFSAPIGVDFLNGANYVFQMDEIVNLVVEFDVNMGLRQLGIEGFGSNPKAKEWERDGYYKSLYTDADEDDDDDLQEEGDNNDYTDDDEEEDE
ncbi:hypothetical protein RIB2604_01503020 [Aspergillus luchuensis]|uniref:F-box domain-containing protein n=2 Tax=Aspergillus kawachii TaxID=1069201 RepID=A0A146F964_ASPKA|nr:hypothetical protein RIB2604_01503020 [Aspergillus luchuensis]